MRRRRPARLAVIWLLAVLVLALGWSDRGEAGAAKQPATIPDEGPRGQSNSGKSTVASSGNGRRGAGELVVRPRAELSPLAPAPDDRDPLKALHRAREDPLEKLRRAAGAGGLAQPAVQLPDATPLLIVSTLDGQLHGIDKAAGKILWSTSAGGDGIISSGAALFAPATKPGQPAPGTPKPPEWDWEDDDEDGRPSNDDGLDNDMIYTSNEEKPDVVYIAEPMGGGQLYVYQNGRAMQKLPLPIRDLVALSPFRSADGTIYIGRKTTRFLALEPYTGKVVGDYGGADADANVCAAMNPDLGGKKGECDVSEEAVYVGRTEYHLSIFSPPNAGRPVARFNITYAEYSATSLDDLSLLLTPQQLHACDPLRLVPTPAGGLILENADTGSKKVVRLKTPVVGGFNIFEVNPSNPGIVRGRYHLHRVFPLGSSETTAEPDDKVTALEHAFIGSHNGSLYALSSAHFAPEIPETVEEPVVIAEPVGGDDEQPNNSNSLSSIAPDGSVIGCVPSSENYPACLVGLRLPVLDPPPLVPPTLPPNDTGAAQPARDTAVATESPTVAQPARFSILRILWIGTGLVLVAAAGAAALYLYLQSQGVSAGTGESNGGFISVNTKRKRGSRGSGKGNKEQQGKETANDLQSDPPAILADADQSEKAEPGLKDKENGKVDGNSAPNDSPTEDAEGADVKDGEEAANGNATPKMGPKRKRKPHSAKRKEQEQTPRPASNVPAPSEKPVTLQPEAPARPVSPAPAPAPDKPLPRVPGLPESASPKMIQVTPQILGYGSHGTVVYKGSFQGRECAVKRLLLDFYDVADHEVNLLRESDDHPNVIRYFAREQCDRFMYIALELCPASVYDIVERANVPEFRELRKVLTPPQVVYQMMLGIAYLHRLKVVHRDIKPQNILITQGRPTQPPRVVISDFGLGKKLEDNQSSFNNTMHTAAGTVGWRAPECMPHPSNLSDSGQPSDSTPGDSHSSSKEFGSGVRITKAVDIFSAGCVFYYIVSGGEHPFGDRYEREVNILRGNYRLDKLVGMGEEGVEAADLIAAMIARNYKERPSAADILTHPYFWTPAQRLTFLMDASDRFEIEVRDPPSPLLQKLEGGARDIVGVDWHKRLDKGVIENLGKHRKYDGVLIRDLLRALRNKKHHYQDLPEPVKRTLGPLPEGFLSYFTGRFPHLLLHVYRIIAADEWLREEMVFRPYFANAKIFA